jgi:hypothetical protein
MIKPVTNINSRIASIITGIGIIIIVISFFLFLLNHQINKHLLTKREEKIKDLTINLQKIKAYNPASVVCNATPLNFKDDQGHTMYNFSLQIDNSILVKKLNRVDYFFDNSQFHPKLKTSTDSSHKFNLTYSGWGTVKTLKVFLHHKNSSLVDTVLFDLADNVHINLAPQ